MYACVDTDVSRWCRCDTALSLVITNMLNGIRFCLATVMKVFSTYNLSIEFLVGHHVFMFYSC